MCVLPNPQQYKLQGLLPSFDFSTSPLPLPHLTASPISNQQSRCSPTVSSPGSPPRSPLPALPQMLLASRTTSPSAQRHPPPTEWWPSSLYAIQDPITQTFLTNPTNTLPELPGGHDEAAWWRCRRCMLRPVSQTRLN